MWDPSSKQCPFPEVLLDGWRDYFMVSSEWSQNGLVPFDDPGSLEV